MPAITAAAADCEPRTKHAHTRTHAHAHAHARAHAHTHKDTPQPEDRTYRGHLIIRRGVSALSSKSAIAAFGRLGVMADLLELTVDIPTGDFGGADLA